MKTTTYHFGNEMRANSNTANTFRVNDEETAQGDAGVSDEHTIIVGNGASGVRHDGNGHGAQATALSSRAAARSGDTGA